jgi:hypothetical protein
MASAGCVFLPVGGVGRIRFGLGCSKEQDAEESLLKRKQA